MNPDVIYHKANSLVHRMGTRDSEKIARELGIWIYDIPDLKDLLGMYTCHWNHRMIFLNPRMEQYLRQMVIAHELGHDSLHRDKAKASQDGLKEFSLFTMKDITEYEANAFAAHILLDNEEVCHYAEAGYDLAQLARAMGADANLMLIKLREMNKLGYNFSLPCEPDSRFFRKIRT